MNTLTKAGFSLAALAGVTGCSDFSHYPPAHVTDSFVNELVYETTEPQKLEDSYHIVTNSEDVQLGVIFIRAIDEKTHENGTDVCTEYVAWGESDGDIARSFSSQTRQACYYLPPSP